MQCKYFNCISLAVAVCNFRVQPSKRDATTAATRATRVASIIRSVVRAENTQQVYLQFAEMHLVDAKVSYFPDWLVKRFDCCSNCSEVATAVLLLCCVVLGAVQRLLSNIQARNRKKASVLEKCKVTRNPKLS